MGLDGYVHPPNRHIIAHFHPQAGPNHELELDSPLPSVLLGKCHTNKIILTRNTYACNLMLGHEEFFCTLWSNLDLKHWHHWHPSSYMPLLLELPYSFMSKTAPDGLTSYMTCHWQSSGNPEQMLSWHSSKSPASFSDYGCISVKVNVYSTTKPGIIIDQGVLWLSEREYLASSKQVSSMQS